MERSYQVETHKFPRKALDINIAKASKNDNLSDVDYIQWITRQWSSSISVDYLSVYLAIYLSWTVYMLFWPSFKWILLVSVFDCGCYVLCCNTRSNMSRQYLQAYRPETSRWVCLLKSEACPRRSQQEWNADLKYRNILRNWTWLTCPLWMRSSEGSQEKPCLSLGGPWVSYKAVVVWLNELIGQNMCCMGDILLALQ